jgi:hypothetical protein
MPNVTINIPPAAVESAVAALRSHYADLPTGQESALNVGVARMVADTLRDLSYNRSLRAANAQANKDAEAAAITLGGIQSV